MIRARIAKNGFEISGHSGYSQAGEDIVCAAASAAAGLVICAAEEVMGLKCTVEADESVPLLRFFVSSENEKSYLIACEYFLKALELQLLSVQREYPEYIKVIKSEVL